MRSFIMTAAIAAALASTSLTAGYAASSSRSGGHATVTRSVEDSTINRTGTGLTDTSINRTGTYVGERVEQADPVPPVTVFPRWAMAPQWSMAASPMSYRHGRLSQIESELGMATHRISVDRRRGELTPREVGFVRREERTVRREALSIARRNGGGIPQVSYVMLQDRVADLNRTINRYATNTARL